jgi:hypothetical protein
MRGVAPRESRGSGLCVESTASCLTAQRSKTTPLHVSRSPSARVLLVVFALWPLVTQAHRDAWLCLAPGQHPSDDCACPHAHDGMQPSADSRLSAVPCCAILPGGPTGISPAVVKRAREATPRPQVFLESVGALDFDKRGLCFAPRSTRSGRGRASRPLYLTLRTLLR